MAPFFSITVGCYEGMLNPLLQGMLQQAITLFEIRYSEAKTYDISHNSLLGILFIGIGISATIIMIGYRMHQYDLEMNSSTY